MTRRITGFSRAAKSYIERNPGKTAQEIVRRLRQTGAVQSAAQEPEGSLVATLHKHHRQLGLRRDEGSRPFKYYPKNGTSPLPPASANPFIPEEPVGDKVSVTLLLSRSVTDVADALVVSGACQNRGEAVNWLITKGISAIRLTR